MGARQFNQLQQELESQEKVTGLSMTDILALPDHLRQLMKWMVREKGLGLADVAAYVGQDDATTRVMLGTLMEKGFVHEVEVQRETRYRVRMAQRPRRRRKATLDIWQKLD